MQLGQQTSDVSFKQRMGLSWHVMQLKSNFIVSDSSSTLRWCLVKLIGSSVISDKLQEEVLLLKVNIFLDNYLQKY
jgi:hypothetical protein